MSFHQDEPFDPSKPALIVTVGNTARKHRALNRDVVVLGRAHGCDIGLSAPDVSSVHCLIYRRPDGLYIRDCQSRSGTHVNGLAIQEKELRDGDAIQVGPFSFQAYLPTEDASSVVEGPSPADAAASSAPPERTGSAQMQHLERARQRLTRLALNLRRRLQEARTSEEEQATLAGRQAELDQQAEFLRGRAREYEQRARTLEQAERALAADRAALEREAAAQEQRRRQETQDLAERRAALERLPAFQLLQDELAGHRQLTGLALPGTDSLSDTPIPTGWREWLEQFGTVRAEPTPDAVPQP